MSSDYEPLRLAETDPAVTLTWRYRGRGPSPEHHANNLWSGVLTQFIINDLAAMSGIGLVTCYEADLENELAYVSALRFAGVASPLAFAEGAMLFIDYLFSVWTFRFLYLDTTQLAMQRYALLVGRLLEEQARLREYYRTPDGNFDRVILCLRREEWSSYRRGMTLGSAP